MKNITRKMALFFATCFFITPVLAQNGELETARKNITQHFEGVSAKDIFPSPIPGLYQVSMPPRFFYASADGRYFVKGDLIDLVSQQNVSLAPRKKSVSTAIEALGEESMIVFGKDTLKHTITVFTDIDCGYCRKLHNEIKKYNEHGIRVRYLAYPRAGEGSGAYKKAEAVWCSKDKTAAMTTSKSGGNVKAKKCDNPVAKHYKLGEDIGIRGTPAIVLSDGTVVPGYIPAKRLSDGLNQMIR